MRARRSGILVAVAGLVAGAGWYVARKVADVREQSALHVGCHSDNLYALKSRIEDELAKNGRLRDPAAIMARLDPAHQDGYARCIAPGRPAFAWNPRLTEYTLASPGRVPIVWCPPGTHGRWAGVLVLEAGKIASEIWTRDDLERLIGRGEGK
ncbi:MAG TPA: hypothetical protein VEA69_12820 [Tepidisphaeraceae bacterium]|nr:hypothetical protein [Tepidisphaeraceae bacterium]